MSKNYIHAVDVDILIKNLDEYCDLLVGIGSDSDQIKVSVFTALIEILEKAKEETYDSSYR